MKTLNKVEITIPEPFIKDFTIIYKGEEELGEIKTSKDEILRKLRYFKLKYNEISLQNEIIIHDNYSFDTFNKFISTFETKKIEIDSNNFQDYYELSTKYEYDELKNQVEKFIKTRPDLNQIVNHLSSEEN